VISDATAEYDKERHDHALNTIGFIFGWVDTVQDVLDAWVPESQNVLDGS
jgi:hypothetical protein